MEEDCKHPTSEIYENLNLGVTACGACGKVINEQLRVETYPAQTPGAVVPRFRPIHRSLSVAEATPNGELSRTCMESVRKDLFNLSHRVRTSEAVVNTAQRLYSMLVDRGMNTAVERRITLGVCLYIACRLEKTNHIISQFVHAVGTTISNFNALFVRISHALELGIHAVGPESYLESLIEHLDLGKSAPHITARAEEVLEKMHDGWLDYGRFPFGVVAAAVLIACQLSGHTQSVDTLSEIVMMSSNTLLRRLHEFSQSNFLVETGECNDAEAPPVFLQHREVGYLLKRLNSYHLRLRGMRRTILEMFAGFSQVRTPLCLSTWKSYWNTRSVASALCLQIAKRNDVTDRSVPHEKISKELEKYGAPAYMAIRTPDLDEDAINIIQQEIASLDRGIDESYHSTHALYENLESTATANKDISEVERSTVAPKGSNIFIGVIDEESTHDAGNSWEMVTMERNFFRDESVDQGICQDDSAVSSLLNRSNRVDTFPEIEYEEKNVQHRREYIREVLGQREKKKAHSIDGPERRFQVDGAENTSLSSHVSFPTIMSSRSYASSMASSSRKRTLVSKSAESPGQSVLSQLARGSRSGFDKGALIELFDGKTEGIDVPSWNESVIDLHNLHQQNCDPLSS